MYLGCHHVKKGKYTIDLIRFSRNVHVEYNYNSFKFLRFKRCDWQRVDIHIRDVKFGRATHDEQTHELHSK